MPYLTLETVKRVCADLGHSDLEVYQAPSGFWRCRCACGYESTRRRTRRDASEAAGHHMMVAYRQWAASGRANPATGTLHPEVDHAPSAAAI